MSSETYESFVSKSISLLDLAFFTYIALAVVGSAFYAAALPKNVQNTLPIILVLFLATISWVVRIKMKSIDVEEIRPLMIQWFIVSVLLIIFSVIIVLIYPIS